ADLGHQILRLQAEVLGQLVNPDARADRRFWGSCSVVSADHDVPWLREIAVSCRRSSAVPDDMSTGCLKARASTPGRSAASTQLARGCSEAPRPGPRPSLTCRASASSASRTMAPAGPRWRQPMQVRVDADMGTLAHRYDAPGVGTAAAAFASCSACWVARAAASAASRTRSASAAGPAALIIAWATWTEPTPAVAVSSSGLAPATSAAERQPAANSASATDGNPSAPLKIAASD